MTRKKVRHIPTEAELVDRLDSQAVLRAAPSEKSSTRPRRGGPGDRKYDRVMKRQDQRASTGQRLFT
jgi:hypothetical protein